MNGVRNIAFLCQREDIPVTFTSSITAKNPTNLYAQSKVIGEHLFQEAEINQTIFRLSNVVGAGTDKGQVQDMIEQGVMDDVIDVWENGNVYRSYISVHQVVEYLVHSIDKTFNKKELGSTTYSNRALADLLTNFIEADIELVEDETPSPSRLTVDRSIEGTINQAVREQVEHTKEDIYGDS
jgi:nucleoside-diphosphate-sugar epimerase